MMTYFTGVGTRNCPNDILVLITNVSYYLCKVGYILRSGGADGCDKSFEEGCDKVNGGKEIFLPWKNFNDNGSSLFNISDKAYELAATIHPAWNILKQGAKKLHARNCYQVLGGDLNLLSKFLICYTGNGEEKGGTRTAIMLAKNNNIKIYNLGIKKDLEYVVKKLNL